MEKQPQKQVKLEIQMDDAVADGQYVNMVVVNHNDSEFVIDCAFVQPQAPKARVRSRLIISPRHAKRLLSVLQTNIDNYEKQFGVIETGSGKPVPSDERPVH